MSVGGGVNDRDDEDDGGEDEGEGEGDAGPRVPLNVDARAQLAAAMAHEVRNPLNSLAIHGDLLSTRLERLGAALPADERAAIERSIATMAGEIDRIDRILEGYLEMVGPEEPERTATAPAQLVEEAVARAREAAAAAEVRVEVRVAPGADGGAAPWAIDRAAMVDALGTLIGDAVAGSARGGRVEVELVAPRDGYAELRVRGGAGRAAEALARIFSFTGAGGAQLIVARQVAKAHGGSPSIQRVADSTLYTLRLAID